MNTETETTATNPPHSPFNNHISTTPAAKAAEAIQVEIDRRLTEEDFYSPKAIDADPDEARSLLAACSVSAYWAGGWSTPETFVDVDVNTKTILSLSDHTNPDGEEYEMCSSNFHGLQMETCFSDVPATIVDEIELNLATVGCPSVLAKMLRN